MTITKRPVGNTKAIKTEPEDAKAEAFISGASSAMATAQTGGKVPVVLRFDPQLLQRIDAAAKRRSINRTAWIQFTLSRALDIGDI